MRMNEKITYEKLNEVDEFRLHVVYKIRKIFDIVEPDIDPGEIVFSTMWKTGSEADTDLIIVNLEIGTTDEQRWISLTMPIEMLNLHDLNEIQQAWDKWRNSEQVKRYKDFEFSYFNFKAGND